MIAQTYFGGEQSCQTIGLYSSTRSLKKRKTPAGTKLTAVPVGIITQRGQEAEKKKTNKYLLLVSKVFFVEKNSYCWSKTKQFYLVSLLCFPVMSHSIQKK